MKTEIAKEVISETATGTTTYKAIRRLGKTTISNMVICNYHNLSDAAFRLYCILSMLTYEHEGDGFADGFISIKSLADIADRTPETIQVLLKELMDNELIDWTARKLLDTTKWLNTPSQFILHTSLEHFIEGYDPRFGYFPMVDGVRGIVLFPDAYHLYRIFAMLAGNGVQVSVSIKELSKLFNNTPKDTRKWLQVLIEHGIIEVIAPDTYVIHDAYRDTLEA